MHESLRCFGVGILIIRTRNFENELDNFPGTLYLFKHLQIQNLYPMTTKISSSLFKERNFFLF